MRFGYRPFLIPILIFCLTYVVGLVGAVFFQTQDLLFPTSTDSEKYNRIVWQEFRSSYLMVNDKVTELKIESLEQARRAAGLVLFSNVEFAELEAYSELDQEFHFPTALAEDRTGGLGKGERPKFDNTLHPDFNPWVFTADTIIPIIDLDMHASWHFEDSKGSSYAA